MFDCHRISISLLQEKGLLTFVFHNLIVTGYCSNDVRCNDIPKNTDCIYFGCSLDTEIVWRLHPKWQNMTIIQKNIQIYSMQYLNTISCVAFLNPAGWAGARLEVATESHKRTNRTSMLLSVPPLLEEEFRSMHNEQNHAFELPLDFFPSVEHEPPIKKFPLACRISSANEKLAASWICRCFPFNLQNFTQKTPFVCCSVKKRAESRAFWRVRRQLWAEHGQTICSPQAMSPSPLQ